MKLKTKIICGVAAAILVVILIPKKDKSANAPSYSPSYGLSAEERQRLREPSPDTYKTELQEMNERAERENRIMEDERLRERVRNRGY
jgi:hypothetical protein